MFKVGDRVVYNGEAATVIYVGARLHVVTADAWGSPNHYALSEELTLLA